MKKDVKLFGYDFRGHTRGMAMAILTTRVQRFFHLFFLSTTSEKSFIPCKPSAAVISLKVCPGRPRVLFWRFVQCGQESCLSSSAKSLVQLGNTFTQSGCGCLKKCLQLSILLPLPSHKLHTFPKTHKKKSWGITLLEKLRAAGES